MKRLLVLVSITSLAAGLLYAQSIMEMKGDARKDLAKADAELNSVYKKALATRSEKGMAALREAQRAWITYRDKTAEAYGTGEEGGSLEGLMFIKCSAALTRSRTKELKELFLSDHYPY